MAFRQLAWPVWLIIALLLTLALRRAWVCDDAYITFRAVDNLVGGHGPVWNVSERVQVFTNPLWMLLVSALYALTGEPYLTSIFLSLFFTLLAALILAVWVARSPQGALLALLALALSNAFVDYATSGLENALAHLLLALFMAVYLRRPHALWLLSLIASLGGLNRLDALLFYLPALLVAGIGQVREKGLGRALLMLALGQMPLLAWLAFAAFYYGSTLPNTALAKLNTGIPALALIDQGFAYLGNSLRNDPLTLTAIGGGVALSLERWRQDRRALSVAAGIGLYLVYLLRIGGDFASGRFLTAPLFCAAALIAQFSWARWPRRVWMGVALLILLLGLLSPHPALLAHYGDYEGAPWDVFVDRRGIADERMWYYPEMALFHAGRVSASPDHLWRRDGERLRAIGSSVVMTDSIGMRGYYAGPNVHLVDKWALADPLLARLPAYRQVYWRIGHFDRVIPPGYEETLWSGQNRIGDQKLALYYEKLRLVTRGALFDPARLREVWRLNTGQYEYLIDRDRYRHPYLVRVTLDEVAAPKAAGTARRARGNTLFYDSGIEIDLGATVQSAQIEVSLDANDDYQIVYLNGDRVVGRQTVGAADWQPVLAVYDLDVPRRAARRGYARIRILPLRGDGTYVLGHLILK